MVRVGRRVIGECDREHVNYGNVGGRCVVGGGVWQAGQVLKRKPVSLHANAASMESGPYSNGNFISFKMARQDVIAFIKAVIDVITVLY